MCWGFRVNGLERLGLGVAYICPSNVMHTVQDVTDREYIEKRFPFDF